MENFMFSVNSTMPIFLLIVLGYVLRRIGLVSEHFVKETNRFNFVVTLPVLLFKDLMETDVAGEFDPGFILFCAGATTVSFFSVWFLAKHLLKDKSLTGEFVQASFRCSAAVMGIAFVVNMYGDAGMSPMMIIGTVPLLNIYSVVVLTFESPDGQRAAGKEKIRETVVNVVKNPIIISILLGVIAALIHLKLPTMLQRSVDYVSNLASPLALIGLGAGFEGRKALVKLKPTFAASLLKLVIIPAVFLPLAVWLGYKAEYLVAIMIMLAAPTTPSCYIMAKNMGHEGVLTSSVVVMTTLLAALSLTGWIFLLRTLGLI